MHGRNVLVETLSDQSSYVTHFFLLSRRLLFTGLEKQKLIL